MKQLKKHWNNNNSITELYVIKHKESPYRCFALFEICTHSDPIKLAKLNSRIFKFYVALQDSRRL